MQITQPKIVMGVTSVAIPQSAFSTAKPTLGGVTTQEHPLANVHYAVRIRSLAAAGVARLSVASGACWATGGTLSINNAGVDFEGVALPLATRLHGILIRASADNGGYVEILSNAGHPFPDMVLMPGEALALNYALAGRELGPTHFFDLLVGGAGNEVTVEVLAQSA